MPERLYAKPVARDGQQVIIEFDNETDAERFAILYKRFGKSTIGLLLDDGRGVTQQQRKFAHALMRDIGDWWSDAVYSTPVKIGSPLEGVGVKDIMYGWFEELTGVDNFSLSDELGNLTDTNRFINFLLDFVFENDVPLSLRPVEELPIEEVAHMEYRALMSKRCVIDGKKPSELHHIEAIGSGRNRNTINHFGIPAIQLCNEHHREADSTLGWPEFSRKYHVGGIKINLEIAKAHHLRAWEV